MARSWRVMASNSAADRSRRARWATQRTSSGVSAMRSSAGSEVGGHLEGAAALGPLHAAAADALDTDAQALHRAADLALDVLQVGLEGAAADAGRLAADAAEVLGLAAVGV